MPLHHQGIVNHGGDIDNKLQKAIDNAFSIIDDHIKEISRNHGLNRKQIRLLQPTHLIVLVGKKDIFVAMSAAEIGSIVIQHYQDWSEKHIDLDTAIFLAGRDLGFRDPFGLEFSRSILNIDDNEDRKSALLEIAIQYVNREIERADRLNKIVKINPIFSGREFELCEKLAFVLSPFGEPFDTIYKDHIKPTVEGIGNFTCLRADDIYDNRPIIEDIWRYTNEARILISELTGRNANVFYETGIAHTVGKEVILVTQSMEDVPFDLKHLRCIVYEYTPRGIGNLEDNLKNTILQILARRK